MISLYLERLVAWLYALLGSVLLIAGIALLAYQAYLWVDLGFWGQMPVSDLFVESSVPPDRPQVVNGPERGATPNLSPPAGRELTVKEKLNSVIPGWLRSDASWLAAPRQFLGLHAVLIRFLEFLSIPALLILAGALCIGISLSKPKSDAVWERREPTL